MQYTWLAGSSKLAKFLNDFILYCRIPMGNKSWWAAGGSDIGRRRKVNEDAFLDGSKVGMWCVADGLGGHANGELASRMIVDYLARLNRAELFPLAPAQIDQCMHVVNAQLIALAASHPTGKTMSSTAAVLILGHAQVHCLWAGNCRIYRLRDEKLCQLSHDHNQVRKRRRRVTFSPQQAPSYPYTQAITRAIGINKNLKMEVVSSDLQANDIFLLCSDGLSSVVEDDEIAFILQTKGAKQATKKLIKTALAQKTRDNVTVIAVHYLASPEASVSAV
jgi:serine/threonine protein phosphatase PrpC